MITPFGAWNRELRTLRISPEMFVGYKEMELHNQDFHDLDRHLDRLRPVLGIGEVKLIVDYAL